MPEFDYATARTAYLAESEKLQQNQRTLYDAETKLSTREARLEVSDTVQQGSNDKARKALFIEARKKDEVIQELEKLISGLKEAVATGRVLVHAFDRDMAYCIALAGHE